MLFRSSSIGYRDTEYWVKDGGAIPEEVIREVGDRFYCKEFLNENGKVYRREPIREDIILYGNKYEEL